MSPISAEFNVEGHRSLTLQVAWRRRDQIEGGHINVAQDASEALATHAREILGLLDAMDARDYWPDANLQQGEYYAIARADVDDSLGVLDVLDAGPDSPLLSPEEMAGRLLFYSVIVGDDPERRVAVVSKSNPAQALSKGLWLTPHGNTFTRVETPLFLFENRADLVVGPETILVLNQLAFEQWFRDSPAIERRVGEWVDHIHEYLPLADDGGDRLKARAATNFRVRRLLRNISERGHLVDVPIERIRRHIAQQGLDEAALLRDGTLILSDDDPDTLLKLLNEDLFLGGLTDVPFVSDNKAPRP